MKKGLGDAIDGKNTAKAAHCLYARVLNPGGGCRSF